MKNSMIEERSIDPALPSHMHWTTFLTLVFTCLFLVLLVVLCIPAPYSAQAMPVWLYRIRVLNLVVVALFPLPLCLLSGSALYHTRRPQWKSGASFAWVGLLV